MEDIINDIKSIIVTKANNRINLYNKGFIANFCDLYLGIYLLKAYNNIDNFNEIQLSNLNLLLKTLRYGH